MNKEFDEEWMNAPMGTPKQQPPASKFTKEIREAYDPEGVPITYENVCTDINDLCARLDQAKASNKDLVTACEAFEELKSLKEQMNQIIDQRENGLVGIQVRNDDLAKEYQKLYMKRQALKPKVSILVEAAIAQYKQSVTPEAHKE